MMNMKEGGFDFFLKRFRRTSTFAHLTDEQYVKYVVTPVGLCAIGAFSIVYSWSVFLVPLQLVLYPEGVWWIYNVSINSIFRFHLSAFSFVAFTQRMIIQLLLLPILLFYFSSSLLLIRLTHWIIKNNKKTPFSYQMLSRWYVSFQSDEHKKSFRHFNPISYRLLLQFSYKV